jgi:uncharacterized membrane protein
VPETPQSPSLQSDRTNSESRLRDASDTQQVGSTGYPQPSPRGEDEELNVDASGRLWSAASALVAFFRRDGVVFLVLAIGFVARWLLAGTQSYWLDELYAVALYGIWNDTVFDAISNLANTSIHPPLFQFVLYAWMSWLGDGEVATRLLSNLYVTSAGFFLYLLVRDAFSRIVALWSTAIFSLMYVTMFFGLEVRSYGQTIFLATLSSYLLLRIVRKGAEIGWRSAVLSLRGTALLLANTALLLTHYYNLFFVVAQALCAAAFIFLQLPRRRWIAGLGSLTAIYLLPVVAFGVIWGQVFITSFRNFSGVSFAERRLGLVELLRDFVFRQNLSAPRLILIAGGTLAVAVLVRAAIRIGGGKRLDAGRQNAYSTLYLFAWLVLPVAVAYAAFSLLDTARYSDRYFLYSTVPLAPIVVLAIAEAWRLARSVSPRLQQVSFAGLVGITVLVVMATTIVPGTYSAAASDKADWRGTAQDIVGLVESDPDSRYLLYETSFRATPVLDYYLARHSENIRVDGVIRRGAERRGEGLTFEEGDEFIQQHDFLIVVFVHHTTEDFPLALATLEERYEVYHRHLDAAGRGYIVFLTRPVRGS